MKYVNNNKKSFLPWVVVALTVLLVAMVLVVTLLPGENPPAVVVPTHPTDQGGETVPTGETAEFQPSTDDLRIETPYADLYYPGDWSGLIQVDQIPGDPHRVVFTAKLDSGIQQELFSVIFGGSIDGSIGVVTASGKEIPVHLSVQEINPGADWTDNEISTVYAMQECLNDVLAGLNLTTPQQDPQGSQTPADDENMAIETPIGELYYPARWKDYLKLEISQTDAYVMEFCAQLDGMDPVQLFNVYLDGESGIHVTDVTTAEGAVVKVSVEIFQIKPDSSWTDAQRSIILAMQEDINTLLAGLN